MRFWNLFRLVKSWKVKHPGFAYEWVCKQLLAGDGHKMWGEETKAKTPEVVAAMEQSIKLIETGEFVEHFPKSKMSKTLRKIYDDNRAKELCLARCWNCNRVQEGNEIQMPSMSKEDQMVWLCRKCHVCNDVERAIEIGKEMGIECDG